MRILITGGFGFIGGRLGQHLQQVGHQIVLGSRQDVVSPDWLADAEVVRTDWKDPHALEQLCDGVDVVIHAAGMNAQDCSENPVAALEFNGVATARLVKAASRQRVKRFIYISTAHVYASPLVGTITEDTCSQNLHPYATTHRAGEDLLLGTCQRGNMEGVVLRLSNAFGAPAHKNVNCWMLLVNDLCRQAVQTGKMILRSNGLQQRDFIAMEEICRVAGCLTSNDLVFSTPKVFNVGSGSAQSVLNIAELIQQRCKLTLGYEAELQHPNPQANEKSENLKYCTDGLAEIGFSVVGDNSLEIDKLLMFCCETFVQNWRNSI